MAPGSSSCTLFHRQPLKHTLREIVHWWHQSPLWHIRDTRRLERLDTLTLSIQGLSRTSILMGKGTEVGLWNISTITTCGNNDRRSGREIACLCFVYLSFCDGVRLRSSTAFQQNFRAQERTLRSTRLSRLKSIAGVVVRGDRAKDSCIPTTSGQPWTISNRKPASCQASSVARSKRRGHSRVVRPRRR